MNNNTIEEMWTELQSYQPFADLEGHGDTWRTMCEKRTKEAAFIAADAAWAVQQSERPMRRSPWAALWAANVMEMEVNVDYPTNLAIEDIRRAKEAKR
jgi:hypothetical protein